MTAMARLITPVPGGSDRPLSRSCWPQTVQAADGAHNQKAQFIRDRI